MRADVLVLGAGGMVGSALVRALKGDVAAPRRADLDLRDATAVADYFASHRPGQVYMAAAKVGGIMANVTQPATMLRDNMVMAANVVAASHAVGAKLLYLGSTCAYPRLAEQPIQEDALLTGPLEPTNEAYAVAKIAGVKLCQAYRAQYGCRFIAAMPANLYGPRDNFDLETAHVLPALIRRFHEAEDEVVLWGTGTPRREFLHVDDCAAACVLLMERYDDARPVNVGSGLAVSIAELASLVAEVTGFTGKVRYDDRFPDGTPHKIADCRTLHALGWRPRVSLPVGIASTYDWFKRHIAA